jgi:hypothetical protein
MDNRRSVVYPSISSSKEQLNGRNLMISALLNTIWKALKTLSEFLAILLLGLLAALLLILPWLMRALALVGWLAGTFLIWMTVNDLYIEFTPALPLFALSAIPAILSSALVVWLFIYGQQGKLWGAMILWGVIGWLVWKGSMLMVEWQYGTLIVQILPAALSAVLMITITLRWGPVIRERRLTVKDRTMKT